VLLNGIFKRARKVWKSDARPDGRRRLTVPKRTDIEFYSPEEVHALVRAAANGQDAALFLTGALTGLRMGELLALRWRDIDFPAQTLRVTASYTNGKLGTPKSGLGRAVAGSNPFSPTKKSKYEEMRTRRSRASQIAQLQAVSGLAPAKSANRRSVTMGSDARESVAAR